MEQDGIIKEVVVGNVSYDNNFKLRRKEMEHDKHIEGNKHRRLSVNYSKGGINWASGNNEKRGIWVSLADVEKSEPDEYGCVVVKSIPRASSNFRCCVRELGRKSQKQVEEVFNKLKDSSEVYAADGRTIWEVLDKLGV